MSEFKVGDELAFQHSIDGISIEKIIKITPSGIIKTPWHELKPNLQMRGKSGGSGYFRTTCLGKATPQHKEQIERKRKLKAIKSSVNTLDLLNDEEIDAIYNILFEPKQ